MRRSHIRLIVVRLAGAVAVPVTMRVARGIENMFGRQERNLDGIELRKLFNEVPDDARPDLNGQWSPRAWNKFQLWLDGLKGRRVHFIARSESISPWEAPGGQRRVNIEFEHLQIVICGVPVMFDIGGSFPVMVTVSSARELDDWFDAPQKSNIQVEATLASVGVSSSWCPLLLGDVTDALN